MVYELHISIKLGFSTTTKKNSSSGYLRGEFKDLEKERDLYFMPLDNV